MEETRDSSQAFYKPLDEFFGNLFTDDLRSVVAEMPRDQLFSLYDNLGSRTIPSLPPASGSAFTLEPVIYPWPVDMRALGLAVAGANTTLALLLGEVPSAIGISQLGAFDVDTGQPLRAGGRLRVEIFGPAAVERQIRMVRRLALYVRAVRMPVSEILPQIPERPSELHLRQWQLESQIRLATLAALRPLVDVGAVEIGSSIEVASSAPMPSAKRLAKLKAEEVAERTRLPFVHIDVSGADRVRGATSFIEHLTYVSLTSMQVHWKATIGTAIGGTPFFENSVQRKLFKGVVNRDLRASEHVRDLYRGVLPDPEMLTTQLVVDLRTADENFHAVRHSLSRAVREIGGYLPGSEWEREAPALISDYIAADVARLTRAVSRGAALRDLAGSSAVGLTIGGLGGLATLAAGGRFVEGAAQGISDGLGSSVSDYVRALLRQRNEKALLAVYASIASPSSAQDDPAEMKAFIRDSRQRREAQEWLEGLLEDAGVDQSLLTSVSQEDAARAAILAVGQSYLEAGRQGEACTLLRDALPILDHDLDVWLLLVDALAADSDSDFVDREYRRILDTSLTADERARVHLHRGATHAFLGNSRRAIAALTVAQGSADHHISSAATVELGALRTATGQTLRGRRLLAAAATSASDDIRSRANLLLADSYARSGQTAKAAERLRLVFEAGVEPWLQQARDLNDEAGIIA